MNRQSVCMSESCFSTLLNRDRAWDQGAPHCSQTYVCAESFYLCLAAP